MIKILIITLPVEYKLRPRFDTACTRSRRNQTSKVLRYQVPGNFAAAHTRSCRNQTSKVQRYQVLPLLLLPFFSQSVPYSTTPSSWFNSPCWSRPIWAVSRTCRLRCLRRPPRCQRCTLLRGVCHAHMHMTAPTCPYQNQLPALF